MSDHTMDEQYVAELLARLAAARKARREAEQQVITDGPLRYFAQVFTHRKPGTVLVCDGEQFPLASARF